MNARTSIFVGALALLVAGCHPMAPEGSIVLTQVPVTSAPHSHATELDFRYPAGSRVVLLLAPFHAGTVRELSRGLFAAGDPCVSWDGRWVYFSGKRSEGSDWQIYKVDAGGGTPEQVTDIKGGAMDPAVAAHEELVFSSPVPKAGGLWTAEKPAALYAQMPGGAPERLSFGPDSAVGSTILRDGRILFVSARARDNRDAPPHLCLYTVNNDGTEVTAYAGQDDGADHVRRPRELDDGRIAFLATSTVEPGAAGRAESVRSVAPFDTRGNLFAFASDRCRSVEPMTSGDVLACLDTRSMVGRSMAANAAVYRIASDAAGIGAPIFNDPRWNSIEATRVTARVEPAGHTSAVKPGVPRGTLLCLNVNDSSLPAAAANTAPAAELRVFALAASGERRPLGKVPVASDGSVIVELPVEVPLGFDTLDAQGQVLRHQPAVLWMRPGENRGCVGCHEPRNHSPRNIRPKATLLEPARLDFTEQPAKP